MPILNNIPKLFLFSSHNIVGGFVVFFPFEGFLAQFRPDAVNNIMYDNILIITYNIITRQ